jgi:carbamoyl-phosphate synthase large subunit
MALAAKYTCSVNPQASRTVPRLQSHRRQYRRPPDNRTQAAQFLPEHRPAKDLDTGSFYYVKSPVFPWNKFPGVDTVLGPEMKSTGEVMGVADNFGEAFAKAQIAAGQKLPTQGYVFVSVTDHDKPQVAEVARKFVDMGFKLVATAGTADDQKSRRWLASAYYKVKAGRTWSSDQGRPNQLIVNRHGSDPFFDEKAIRPRRHRSYSDDHDARCRPCRCRGIAACKGEVNVGHCAVTRRGFRS